MLTYNEDERISINEILESSVFRSLPENGIKSDYGQWGN